MKGIYFSNYDLSDLSSGVSKKINMQVDAFINAGVEIDIPEVYSKSIISKIYEKLPFTSIFYDFKVKKYIYNLSNNVDFVYIRHGIFTRQLISNLKKIKSKGIAILYEIPTYPYDRNEFKIINTFVRIKDRYWRKKAYKYIDRIVDYSGSDKIFNIDTINICNGINPDFIKQKDIFSNSDELHLIGVALIAPVHGFDRVVNSMYEYYKNGGKRRVYFHIVGEGDAKADLEKLTKKYDLSNYIIFHGLKYGADLDNIYDVADIGVGVLGIHRRFKNQKVSSLKTKEYAAKGIPFVSGENDEIFENKDCDFIYKLNQTDNTFKIDSLIAWYDDLIAHYKNKRVFSNHIREYSYKYLTWNRQIAKIVNYLKNILVKQEN